MPEGANHPWGMTCGSVRGAIFGTLVRVHGGVHVRNIRRAAPASKADGSERIPRFMTMAGSCYSLNGVCELMSSEAALVMLAVQGRCLVAVETQQAGSLFPVWQFPRGRVLPHLAEILTALPTERLGPWDTALWFTQRRRALRGQSAAHWLTYGGDPQPVRSLAAPAQDRGDDLVLTTQHPSWLAHLLSRDLSRDVVQSGELSVAG